MGTHTAAGARRQRATQPHAGQIPHVHQACPQAVQRRAAQRTTRPDLVQWFRAIQERLKGVIVLNRSWESALTPTLLMHTPSSPKPPVGILMDPPYITDDRQAELYGSDADGSSTGTAGKAYLWAVEHGDVFTESPTVVTKGISRCRTVGIRTYRCSAESRMKNGGRGARTW